jgi:hypothetical protein
VASVLQRFPGAEIVDVRVPVGEAGSLPEAGAAAPAPDEFMNEDE